jgi:hypothetical protein
VGAHLPGHARKRREAADRGHRHGQQLAADDDVDFSDLGADYFDRLNTAKLKRYHLRRLADLGCDVSKIAAA